MRCICKYFLWAGIISSSLVYAAPAAKPVATLQSVTVTSAPGGIRVEIVSSEPAALRSQVTTDPDRVVLDFPNTQPAEDLRSKLLNQGELKGFRVGRFSANPPTTRVVIDLNSPQHYQIFPDGKTVIVKLMSDQQQAAAKAHIENVSFPPAPPKPTSTLDVEYKSGRLSITADHVSLAQILSEVQRKTGTEISIPPGGGQEQIVVGISPLPLRDAMVSLLNGSRFNFILVDSETEPGKLKNVILSFRSEGGTSQPAFAPPPPPVSQSEPEPEPPPTETPPDMQPQLEAVPQPDAPPQQESQQPPDAPPQ